MHKVLNFHQFFSHIVHNVIKLNLTRRRHFARTMYPHQNTTCYTYIHVHVLYTSVAFCSSRLDCTLTVLCVIMPLHLHTEAYKLIHNVGVWLKPCSTLKCIWVYHFFNHKAHSVFRAEFHFALNYFHLYI